MHTSLLLALPEATPPRLLRDAGTLLRSGLLLLARLLALRPARTLRLAAALAAVRLLYQVRPPRQDGVVGDLLTAKVTQVAAAVAAEGVPEAL